MDDKIKSGLTLAGVSLMAVSVCIFVHSGYSPLPCAIAYASSIIPCAIGIEMIISGFKDSFSLKKNLSYLLAGASFLALGAFQKQILDATLFKNKAHVIQQEKEDVLNDAQALSEKMEKVLAKLPSQQAKMFRQNIIETLSKENEEPLRVASQKMPLHIQKQMVRE